MGCCGRRKEKDVVETQKWKYITLEDFRSKNCWTFVQYFWLWLIFLITLYAYAADVYTAVNFLAFETSPILVVEDQHNSTEVDTGDTKSLIGDPNSEWLKWVFAGTIIASTVLLAWEWFKAIRIIKRGSVAETYLDPWAVQFQSTRLTQGWIGFRKFLVFKELTQSKKGVDYIALFVYFQFKSALRIIVAEGPRQVINGISLWSVAQKNLTNQDESDPSHSQSPVSSFFSNIEALPNRQKIVLFSQLSTVIIWAFFFISLVIAVILYLFFLWAYLSGKGRLSKYCRKKIESRLERIVQKKVKQAIEKAESRWKKDEIKALQASGGTISSEASVSKPTLPDVDRKSFFYPPSRSDSSSTRGGDTADGAAMPAARPWAARTATISTVNSNGSYDEPLLPNAAGMGLSNGSQVSLAQQPSLPNIQTQRLAQDNGYPQMGIQRNFTSPAAYSDGTGYSPIERPGTAPGRHPNFTPGGGGPGPRYPPRAIGGLAGDPSTGPPSRTASPFSYDRTFTPPPGARRPPPPHMATSSAGSGGSYEMRNISSPPPSDLGAPYGRPAQPTPPPMQNWEAPPRIGSPRAYPPRTASPHGGPPGYQQRTASPAPSARSQTPLAANAPPQYRGGNRV